MKYALVFTLVFIVHCLVPTTSFAIIHPIETASHSSIVLKKKMSFKEKISLKFYQLRNVLIPEDTTIYTDEEKQKFGKESIKYSTISLVLFLVAVLLLAVSIGRIALGIYAALAIPFVCFFLSISAMRKGKRAGKDNKNGKVGEILGFFGLLISVVGIVLTLLLLSTGFPN